MKEDPAPKEKVFFIDGEKLPHAVLCHQPMCQKPAGEIAYVDLE